MPNWKVSRYQSSKLERLKSWYRETSTAMKLAFRLPDKSDPARSIISSKNKKEKYFCISAIIHKTDVENVRA